jgi:ABC-type uncharacterized transport system substrate-binding protein
MKKRRAALCAIAVFPLALLAGHSTAQPAARRAVIGLLDASDRTEWWNAFRQQLRKLGYVVDLNVSFELRVAKGELESLSAMARDLVRLKVNVIATSGTAAALAPRRFPSSAIPPTS